MRLIDADEAYKVLTDYYHQRTEIQHKALKEAIDRVPTVDAEPVVRCKDCFICETRQTANYLPFLYCELHDCSVLGDFYCSWGERKEDVKTD